MMPNDTPTDALRTGTREHLISALRARVVTLDEEERHLRGLLGIYTGACPQPATPRRNIEKSRMYGDAFRKRNLRLLQRREEGASIETLMREFNLAGPWVYTLLLRARNDRNGTA